MKGEDRFMRILFVSNYAPWEKVARGEMPSQHLFGIHELVKHYKLVGNEVRGILNGGGTLIFIK